MHLIWGAHRPPKHDIHVMFHCLSMGKRGRNKEQTEKDAKAPSSLNSLPLPFKYHAESHTIRLALHVKPNSRVSQLVSMDETALRVQVSGTPHDGEANACVIELLS